MGSRSISRKRETCTTIVDREILQNMSGMIVPDRRSFGRFDSIHLQSVNIYLFALGMFDIPFNDLRKNSIFRVGRNKSK
jgi:hypothetical protein